MLILMLCLMYQGPASASQGDGVEPALRVIEQSMSLWADAISEQRLGTDDTLRRCAALLRDRHSPGAIGTATGPLLVYESAVAYAALLAVRSRIPSRAIERHLPTLARWISRSRERELEPLPTAESQLDEAIDALGEHSDTTERAKAFLEKCRPALSGQTVRRGLAWRETLRPFLATPMTPSDRRVRTMIHLLRGQFDPDRPEMITVHFADPSIVKDVAPRLFAYAALARVLSIHGSDVLVLDSGKTCDWRREIRQRVLALQHADGGWSAKGTSDIADSLARLALAWTERPSASGPSIEKKQ